VILNLRLKRYYSWLSSCACTIGYICGPTSVVDVIAPVIEILVVSNAVITEAYCIDVDEPRGWSEVTGRAEP
jgi:hypothetical protein